jgi:hypothetical protein
MLIACPACGEGRMVVIAEVEGSTAQSPLTEVLDSS